MAPVDDRELEALAADLESDRVPQALPVSDADGPGSAIGSHFEAVQASYRDFKTIALRIAERAGLDVPERARR
jgi:hypothetical protein